MHSYTYRIAVFIRSTAAVWLSFGMLIAGGLAVDGAIYLKIPNIPGESTDTGHADWIDILSMDSTLLREFDPLNPALSVPQFGDIHVTKDYDKSSPLLMLACAEGSSLDDLRLVVTTSTPSGQVKYFEYKLMQAQVTSIELSEGSGTVPFESISLNYERVDWVYTQLDSDGTETGYAEAWWDVQAGTGDGGTGTTTPGNSPPGIDPVSTQSVQPGETREVDLLLTDDNDPVDSLMVGATTTRPDLIKSLSVSGSGANRALSFTVSSLYSGNAAITVEVSDGKDTRSIGFTVLINVEMTPFESFLAAYFTPEEQADPMIGGILGDPDGDRMVNLVEYALVTNPVEYTHPREAVQISREGSVIRINYRRRTDDPNIGPIPWMAPESMLFAPANDNPLYGESAQAGENSLYEDVEGSMNPGNETDPYFFRLQVEYQQ